VKAVLAMFIEEKTSVSWSNYMNLGVGFFAELEWSKKCCKTKSCRLYWGGE